MQVILLDFERRGNRKHVYRHHSMEDGEENDQPMPLLVNVVRHRFLDGPCVRQYQRFRSRHHCWD